MKREPQYPRTWESMVKISQLSGPLNFLSELVLTWAKISRRLRVSSSESGTYVTFVFFPCETTSLLAELAESSTRTGESSSGTQNRKRACSFGENSCDVASWSLPSLLASNPTVTIMSKLALKQFRAWP